jgi:hypothetical protein
MKIATGTASIFDAATMESQREESAFWALSAGVPNNTAAVEIDPSRQDNVVILYAILRWQSRQRPPAHADRDA